VTESDTCYVSCEHELLSLLGTLDIYLDTLMRFAVPCAGFKKEIASGTATFAAQGTSPAARISR
jgi:hypothetical protein